MKYLLVLVVVIAAIGIWRSQRRPMGPARPPQPPRGAAPAQEMVACAHCGLHLPKSDALHDGTLHYCSADHRQKGAAHQP